MLSGRSRRRSVNINPFYHEVETTWPRRLQVVLMSVTVAPVRFLTGLLFIILAYLQATLSVVGMAPAEYASQPMTGWRRKLVLGTAASMRAAFFFAGFYRVRVKGKLASAQVAPVLCVAPHSSFFDIILLCFTNVPSGISRIENTDIPLIGAMIRSTQPVSVTRDDKNSRMASITEIRRRVESRKWPHTLVFPEGTTTNGACLMNFKPGAFLCGVPVQPLVIKYITTWDTYSWTWDGDGCAKLLWYSLCQWYSVLELEYLPVYNPSEAEKADPQLFADNVRQAMADALGIPTTDHSYEDCSLIHHAAKLKLPVGTSIVGFQKVRRELNLDINYLKELLEHFSHVSFGSGRVSLGDFASYMDLPISDALRQLFSLYDRDESGYFDFMDYVFGTTQLAHPANGEDTIRLAFEFFDKGSKGCITEDELANLLYNTLGVSQSAAAVLFAKVDQDNNGRIDYDEFKKYAANKPEYALLFRTYQKNNTCGKPPAQEEPTD